MNLLFSLLIVVVVIVLAMTINKKSTREGLVIGQPGPGPSGPNSSSAGWFRVNWVPDPNASSTKIAFCSGSATTGYSYNSNTSTFVCPNGESVQVATVTGSTTSYYWTGDPTWSSTETYNAPAVVFLASNGPKDSTSQTLSSWTTSQPFATTNTVGLSSLGPLTIFNQDGGAGAVITPVTTTISVNFSMEPGAGTSTAGTGAWPSSLGGQMCPPTGTATCLYNATGLLTFTHPGSTTPYSQIFIPSYVPGPSGTPQNNFYYTWNATSNIANTSNVWHADNIPAPSGMAAGDVVTATIVVGSQTNEASLAGVPGAQMMGFEQFSTTVSAGVSAPTGAWSAFYNGHPAPSNS